MGGGLNHLSLLLEFKYINQNNRNILSLAHGVWTTDVKSTICTHCVTPRGDIKGNAHTLNWIEPLTHPHKVL